MSDSVVGRVQLGSTLWVLSHQFSSTEDGDVFDFDVFQHTVLHQVRLELTGGSAAWVTIELFRGNSTDANDRIFQSTHSVAQGEGLTEVIPAPGLYVFNPSSDSADHEIRAKVTVDTGSDNAGTIELLVQRETGRS